MRAVLIAGTLLLITFGVMAAMARIALRGGGRTEPTPFPLLPGMSAPASFWCSYSHDFNHSYCGGEIDGATVYFTRDTPSNSIRSISYKVGRVEIGTLLTQWGRPTAEAGYGVLRRVYWGTTSALVYAKRFTAWSPVWFVTLALDTEADDARMKAWRGFTK